MDESKTYSYSWDEESYHGPFDSVAEACAEAAADMAPGAVFYVGENKPPAQPEEFWHAYDWLEHVSCQDEYSMDAAEGWDDSTKEQREELELEVRAVMAQWLDRHKLRPQFWVVWNAQKYRVTGEGQFEEEGASDGK